MLRAIKRRVCLSGLAGLARLLAVLVLGLTTVPSTLVAGTVPAPCQTIGAVGTTGPCAGLLIVDRTMLMLASHDLNVTGGVPGDKSFNFEPGDAYTSHTVGTYDFSQAYTGNVTDMSYIFNAAGWIDVDISGWDTSNVANMDFMFHRANIFDQNISGWDTSKVESMEAMFYQTHEFNQPIGTWDTSNVTDMRNMFHGAQKFNSDISGWDTGKVVNMDAMFEEALVFNQPIGSWDVGSVESLDHMFKNNTVFNQPLGQWNVQNVLVMWEVFSGATAFNQDLSTWDMSKVQQIRSMFENATSFNQDIGGWETSTITDMISVFNGATAFDQDLTNWQVCQVIPVFRTDFASHLGAAKWPDFDGPRCSGSSPQVQVTAIRNASAIEEGGQDSLTPLTAGQAITLTYQISNQGQTNLTIEQPGLGGGSAVNASNLSFGMPSLLVATPASTINFDVTFTPINPGTVTIPVSFINSDPELSPFTFTISATVLSVETNLTETYHQASAKHGSRVIGGTMARMSDHVASMRIARRM